MHALFLVLAARNGFAHTPCPGRDVACTCWWAVGAHTRRPHAGERPLFFSKPSNARATFFVAAGQIIIIRKLKTHPVSGQAMWKVIGRWGGELARLRTWWTRGGPGVVERGHAPRPLVCVRVCAREREARRPGAPPQKKKTEPAPLATSRSRPPQNAKKRKARCLQGSNLGFSRNLLPCVCVSEERGVGETAVEDRRLIGA